MHQRKPQLLQRQSVLNDTFKTALKKQTGQHTLPHLSITPPRKASNDSLCSSQRQTTQKITGSPTPCLNPGSHRSQPRNGSRTKTAALCHNPQMEAKLKQNKRSRCQGGGCGGPCQPKCPTTSRLQRQGRNKARPNTHHHWQIKLDNTTNQVAPTDKQTRKTSRLSHTKKSAQGKYIKQYTNSVVKIISILDTGGKPKHKSKKTSKAILSTKNKEVTTTKRKEPRQTKTMDEWKQPWLSPMLVIKNRDEETRDKINT